MTFYDDDIEAKNKESKREFQRRRDREIVDLRSVLKSSEGRRFVWKMLSECGVFRASFSLNAMQTAFAEGRRDIGIMLVKELDEADPGAYAQMQREHYSELKSRKHEKEEE